MLENSDNTVVIEVAVDPDGKATVALKGLEADTHRFANATDKAGQSGLRLREIFTGNLLAEFFERGVSAAVAFSAASVQAAAVASDANRQLEFSATRAGLSYTRSAELAEDFGRRIGASNTEAAKTFGDLVRLSERAGKTGEIETFSKQFADLLAARGIRGAEASSLIGTILSGQDEGLNRLGAEDPGRLNAAYAASIGKTADALNQQEKAAAAYLAVQRLAVQAEGQAEARLRSTAGQLDTAAAAYENLKTQIGESVTNSITFRDTLGTISDALGGLTTSHEQARRELAKGLKTPEQIAQEERDAPLSQLMNFAKGALTVPVVGVAQQFEAAGLVLSGRATRPEQVAANLLGQFLGGDIAAILNPGQRQFDATVERTSRQQAEDFKQQALSLNNVLLTALRTADEARKDALRTDFDENLSGALKEDNLNARLVKLRQVRDELGGLAGALDAEGFEKRSKKIDAAIAETSKQFASAVRTARDAARDFLTTATLEAGAGNPFVKLFVDLRAEVEKTRQQFLQLGFGQRYADQMAMVTDANLQAQLSTARLQSSIQALKFEQEARRLDLPFVGLTGPEQRALDTFNARVGGATRGLAGAAQAEALRAGFTFVDPAYMARRQYEELLKLQGEFSGLPGGAATAARDALDGQLKSLYQGLDERAKREVVNDPAFRETFAGAFARDAQRAEREIRDRVEREQAGNLIQRDARELWDVITASGVRRSEQVKEFLAVTGALPEGELTGDLRRSRAVALREAARQEREQETDAKRVSQKLERVLDTIDAALNGKGLKVDAPPSKVNVNVGDGLTLDRALLGSAPSAEPVHTDFAGGTWKDFD